MNKFGSTLMLGYTVSNFLYVLVEITYNRDTGDLVEMTYNGNIGDHM